MNSCLLPMLGAWAKMRLSNLENNLILEYLFLLKMSFKEWGWCRTKLYFLISFLVGWSVETVDILHNAKQIQECIYVQKPHHAAAEAVEVLHLDIFRLEDRCYQDAYGMTCVFL